MSVPKSMHRMVTVPRGRGMSRMINIKNGLISGMLLVSVYAIDFFKLSKIKRPKKKETTLNSYMQLTKSSMNTIGSDLALITDER